MVGIEVLISMHQDGPTKWSGQLYNDDDGKIYSEHLIETGPSFCPQTKGVSMAERQELLQLAADIVSAHASNCWNEGS